MKILTNKTLSSFLNRLSAEPVSLAQKIEKIDIVIQFTSWLVDSKQLSPNDGIRFRNELYKKKRDLTPKEAPKLAFPLNYVGFSLAALSLLLVLGGVYIRFFRNTKTPFAYSTAPVQAGRNISFQGRLTDSLGNPISAPIDISYSFYTVSSGGSPLSSSTRVCTASPDQDGVFSTLIGKDAGGTGGTLCNVEIPNSVFTENTDVYLGVTVGGGSEMTPRQQIANVGYAINSETLQGMPPGQSVSNIPFINQSGDMLIAAANPGLRSTFASSTFTISSGLATTIQSGTGDITLTATNGGSLRFNTYSSPGNTLERLTIMPTTGRVGVGTAAPRALFDVAGDATLSGSLIAGAQIKIGEFTSPPTNIGNGSTYYDSNTNKIFYWNGTSWADLSSGVVQYWQKTLNSLAPLTVTDSLNIGNTASASAMVHLPGVTNKDAWFSLGTGKVGIGTTTPSNSLHAVDTSTYQMQVQRYSNVVGDTAGILFGVHDSPTNIQKKGGILFERTAPWGVGSLHFATRSSADNTLAGLTDAKLTINSAGNVGVGDTTPGALFTVGSGDLFQIDSSGRIVAIDNVAHTIDDVSGNLTLTSNSSTISLNDNVTFAGTTTLNSQAYTWPGTITNAYILQTNGTGTLSWVDPIGLVGGANLWSLSNGTLYPINTTLDMFVGGTATTSAKFAFINANAGTPTASISGTTANVNTFIDGNGNISTTNRTSLTLGNSATYNSTGNILLNPNGTGNVGIGTANPGFMLDVGGRVNATRFVAPAGAVNDVSFMLGSGGTLGMYSPGTNIVGFSTNGTERMRINDVGNIGVGTTTPTAKLDVAGDASLSGHLVLRGTTPNYIHVMNGTDLRISNSPGGDVGNVDRLTMLNNGSFGFGTTNPTAKIDVRTASGNTGAGIKVGQYTVNGAAGQTLFPTGATWYEYPGIVGVGSGTTTLDIPSLDSYGTVGVVGVGGSSTGGRSNVGIYGHAYFDAAMGGNTGNLLYGGKFTTRITSNANDYKGTSYGLYSKADTTGGTSTAGSVYGLYSQALGQTNNTTYAGYFTGSGGTTNFGIYSNAGTNYFSADVGIGTTAPTAKLDVVGDASVSASLVTRSVTPTVDILNGGNLVFQTSPGGDVGLGAKMTLNNNGYLDLFTLGADNRFRLGRSANEFFSISIDDTTTTMINDQDENAPGYGNIQINADNDGTADGYIGFGAKSGSQYMRIINGGNVGIGDTSPLSLFTVGSGDLFQVNSAGRVVALDGVAHTIDDVTGNLTLTSNSNTISLNDNVTFAGTTTLNSLAYTWPGAQTTGYVLQTDGSGTLSWADPSVLTGGSNLWTSANGSLYPKNATLDLFVGGTATNSAKFAFINANAGTPTASISGTTANVATYLTGNGNLATTNMKTLTVGGATTGAIQLSPNGTTGVYADTTGNIGIGVTAPVSKLSVGNNGSSSYTVYVANGDDYGLYANGNNYGLYGYGANAGVYGIGSTNADGVFGSATGTGRGVIGSSNNVAGYGVYGINTSSGVGGYFLSTSGYALITGTGNVGIGNAAPSYKLDVSGDINLTGAIRANGNAGTVGYLLTSGAGGVNTWTNPSSIAGINYWNITNGSLFPVNATLDAFIGGTATPSAKFAFINVNAGTPTASISGTTANVNTFIDGNGNISTTNRTSLTLGNSATYNSTGNILLNPNGTGNVGIGLTSPAQKLDVSGNLQFSGALMPGGAAGTGGQFLTSAGPGVTPTWTSTVGASSVPFSGITGPSTNTTAAMTVGTGASLNYTGSGTINASTLIGGTWAIPGTIGSTTPNTAAFTTLTSSGNSTIGTGTSTTNTFGAGASSINTIGSVTTPGALTLHGATSLDNSFAQTFAGTTTNGTTITANSLTTGNGLYLSSTSTALTTGGLINLDWSPGSSTIATGDLFSINIGSNGTIGNLLNIKDNGTSIFSISETGVTSNLPTNFTSAGDVSMAYDLIFTNPTASYIKSQAPLYIQSGETFNSSDLNLTTFNKGNVLVNSEAFVTSNAATIGGQLNVTTDAVIAGDINLLGALRANGDAGTSGFVFTSGGGGVNSWTDISNLNSYWTLANGTLYPVNTTLDLLVGGTASNSAKFAFLNANAGTPTASISGTTANVNTFIDGNGNISTTNRTSLVLGNSATYNSTGNILLNPNGTGNVGIGLTAPTNKFEVALASNQIALLGTAGVASGVSFTNGSILSQASQLQIVGISTSPISFYTGGTFDTMTAGTEKMRLSSAGGLSLGNGYVGTDAGAGNALISGKVGVGTTVPLASLDVRKSSGTTPVASVSGATSMSTLVVDQSGTGDILTASASGNPRFVVKNNGNVGIGYANPTYKLAVNGSMLGDILYDSTNPAYYVDPSGDSVFGGGLSLVGGLTGNSASLSGSLTIGNTQMIKSEWGNLNFGYKDTMSTWATGMVLQDTTGNVGIGTTNPGGKLDVRIATNNRLAIFDSVGGFGYTGPLIDAIDDTNGLIPMTFNASKFVFNSGNVGIGALFPLARLDIRGNLGTIPVASVSGSTSMAAMIVDQSGSGDIFTASSSGEPRFVIKSNGNVGIGVANPTGKLSIAGSSSTISNVSGDITFDAASGNISFSNNNLIDVANIASIGQIQIGGFSSAPTSIGSGAMYYDTTSNRVFYWDGTIWSEMGSKYWQRTLGSMAPQYITDALNLGAIATGSALVHMPGTNNQNAWFYLGTGSVGIGTRTPSSTYALDVVGSLRADKYVDSASPAYYVDPAGSSVLGGNLTNQGDIFLIDGSPEISSWDGANYNQITIRGSGDTTSASLCVDEGAGTACDGKINAGTIDPPYTINGKKYATYLPSMTGVKEETTGKVLVTEKNDEAKAYIKRIALGDQPEGSDLWLFGKTTNIKEQIKDMTILLSSNTNGKVWYTVDSNNLVLTLYSSTPSEVSYRLTAPRFDAGKFANRRSDSDYGTGFILNDQGNILAGAAPTYSAPKISVQAGIYSLIGNFVEEFTAANQALFANLTAGIVNTQKIVSPIAEVETLTASKKIQSKEINSELVKASNSINTPRLNTNVIDIGTESGQLAKLVINGLHNIPVVTIDAGGSATFAGSLTAQAVTSEQLTTDNASVSGTLIANEIKSQTIDTLSSQIASSTSTLASSVESLSGDINSVQQELAALKNTPLPNPVYYQNLDASYNSITVADTANIYKAHIADSLVVGSLFVQKNSILALESNLTISSLSTITLFDGSVIIAKNGNITSKGQVSATSLAIKNTQGETVASIDASGSARFNEVVAKKFTLDSIATQGAIIADSGIVNETNTPIPAIKTKAEVAGTGAVPQDTKEVIIYNDNVTANSLIYLTPTANNIQGQLSVTKKSTCPTNLSASQLISTETCTPYFVVSSSQLIHAATPFNWLIIN